MLAVKYNRPDMLLYLLQHKADVSLKNDKGETAVDIAIQLKRAELTVFLELYAKPRLLQAFQQVMNSGSNLQQFSLFAPAKQPEPVIGIQQDADMKSPKLN